MVGILVLVILIPAVAKERASVGFIFTHFNVDDATGIQDKAYTLAVGLLMSQYSVIGYDASAHMVNLSRYVLFRIFLKELKVLFRISDKRKLTEACGMKVDDASVFKCRQRRRRTLTGAAQWGS